jgi:hypothetical protein
MKILTLSIFLFLTLSCNKSDEENSFNQRTITPVLIGKGNLFGNGVENIPQQNIVVSNQNDWNTLITKLNMNGNVTDGFSTTVIDFNNFQLICLFDDIKSIPKFETSITSIVENQENIIVTVQHITLNGDFSLTIITQPFYIVKIPKSSKPLVFQ